MRKIISIMMIMLVLVGAVYAGGSSDKSASSQSQSGKTVVNIWTNDRHDAEYLNEKIAEFNASNQDIEIKMTTVVEDYPNMLVMSYTSGNAPDLFYMNARGTGFDLKTFVDAGMLVPYPDSLLNDPDFEKVTDASKHIVEGINAINGVTVSADARFLSEKWVRGELTGEQMKQELLALHRKIAEEEKRG